jgi:predicted RNase H-like HicB family nuclease
MQRKIFRTLLRKEPEGGYTVIVPLLPGCVTYGATMEEAVEMSKEAIELYLESLIARNEPIPSDENVFEYMVTLEDKKYA